MCLTPKGKLPLAGKRFFEIKVSRDWRVQNAEEHSRWSAFYERVAWQNRATREMLIYAQRKYINKHFMAYDPARQDLWAEQNRPWDFDHIVPQNWVSGQRGEYREYCKVWLNNIGNIAAIPFSVNREKSDKGDWEFYRQNAEDLFFEEVPVRPDLTFSQAEAGIFAEKTHERCCRIYGECYDAMLGFLNAVPEKNVVFWTRFLKPILENFAVFGVDVPDMLLYEEETLEALVRDLEAYFSEPESVEFVNGIVECKIDVTIVPSEMELKKVDCNYQSVTIVDRDCDGFDSSEVPLFYLKCESVQQPATNPSKEEGEQSRADVVKEFLLEAKLVRLERNYETAFQYFQEIANLSCTFNDPILEIGLDKMSEFLEGENPMTKDDLLAMVEKNIEEEENNKSEDPFASISQYSAQFGYITRLNTRVAAITENAKTYVNFLRTRRYLNDAQIDTSLPLVSEYITSRSCVRGIRSRL